MSNLKTSDAQPSSFAHISINFNDLKSESSNSSLSDNSEQHSSVEYELFPVPKRADTDFHANQQKHSLGIPISNSCVTLMKPLSKLNFPKNPKYLDTPYDENQESDRKIQSARTAPYTVGRVSTLSSDNSSKISISEKPEHQSDNPFGDQNSDLPSYTSQKGPQKMDQSHSKLQILRSEVQRLKDSVRSLTSLAQREQHLPKLSITKQCQSTDTVICFQNSLTAQNNAGKMDRIQQKNLQVFGQPKSEQVPSNTELLAQVNALKEALRCSNVEILASKAALKVKDEKLQEVNKELSIYKDDYVLIN